MIANQLVTEV